MKTLLRKLSRKQVQSTLTAGPDEVALGAAAVEGVGVDLDAGFSEIHERKAVFDLRTEPAGMPCSWPG